MEVTQVLRMNGGVGDASYANNSLVQVYLQSNCYNLQFREENRESYNADK